MTGYIGSRFDWEESTRATQCYVIASTYRSGSTYLSTALWRTGVLGAPWEYFNYESEMGLMQARLGVSEFDSYLEKLLPLRTSPNGVFGFKAHFHHFESARERSAKFREMIAEAKFIYIDRRDKLAQAVSLAKALQERAWISLGSPHRPPVFYSFEFIQACLDEIKRQAEGWWRWFESSGRKPFLIVYEELVSDSDRSVDLLRHFLRVAGEDGVPVEIPLPEKQSDEVNADWVGRFGDEWRAKKRLRA